MNRRLVAFACIASLCLLALSPPLPPTTTQAKSHHVTGPLDLSGELHGAPYRIRVPANWNGTLLVFAHGYRDKADHPGEVDNRNADIAPSAALEAPLLAAGYAQVRLIAIMDGPLREDPRYKRCRRPFPFAGGTSDQTILWSVSLGSIIGLEVWRDLAVSMMVDSACARRPPDQPGSGTLVSPLYLAYDVVFGTLPTWGTVGEVRNDIDFETEVLPKLIVEASNPLNFPKFEFARTRGGQSRRA